MKNTLRVIAAVAAFAIATPAFAQGGGGGGGGGGMRMSPAERNDALKAVLKAVLTDEQKKKFAENLAAMPQRRGGV
ncbi:hypothetical protein [Gemmatimonas sp.]|jgi:hypothetical protein|uniref:hypothetical protein n=1 Tax=Gemmatimonas sp. TaxID=1962908 RepID=UPI0037C02F11